MVPETLRWNNGALELLDQRAIPSEVRFVVCGDAEETAAAIENMTVRGAPAIGAAAAYGAALAARDGRKALHWAVERLGKTRPTAVNLFWALERIRRRAEETPEGSLAETLLREAEALRTEDVAANRRLGAYGAKLLGWRSTVLTHCNAGALATCGYGTALGVVRAAVEQGKRVAVYADETRPVLQGGRLTAWELAADGIPVTVICDGMAGALMQQGAVDAVVVGADRIAAGGDTANKIGTYSLAVLARHHDVPFYVAAPWSTVDMALSEGSEIVIEERNPEEVRRFAGAPIVAEAIPVWNPAFDVTPAELISAIVTEQGVLMPPFAESLRERAEDLKKKREGR
ncbi:MAG: S-methyl-5-thioribose-1-phosphate isomerase [Synergistales bacterium]|nr:S-methyl-5-thioribose-1-phosphate isomerase [Synergistales bacterium]